MIKSDLAERIVTMLIHSRHLSGKSQNEVAKKLGYAKSTIQNWENGTSCPSLLDSFRWFDAIDTPIYPYISYVCHSRIEDINPSSELGKKKDRLKKLIDEYQEQTIDELLFMLEGEHGANIAGVLDGFIAYLHLPLKQRISIMQNIGTQFLLCKADNTLSNSNKVMPDTKVLHEYVQVGVEACLQGKNTYV